MHKVFIGGLAALALTAEASAGDLPYPGPCGGRPCPPVYPPPPPSPPPVLYVPPDPYLLWCGPYIGANVGLQSGSVSNLGLRPSGVEAGFQGGFNWRFGQWVAGWESDFQFSTAEDSSSIFRFANPWFGTVRGRGGIAFDNLLFYGTAGFAFGRTRFDVAGLSESNFHIGGTVGAGVEYALSRDWSFKAEFLRVDLSSQHFTLSGADLGLSSNVFRIGVNFHF
jgi:outer membrane immunogenic protein